MIQRRAPDLGTAGHIHCHQLLPLGGIADLLDPLADKHTGVADQDVELAKSTGDK
jgi:hypothetical protein